MKKTKVIRMQVKDVHIIMFHIIESCVFTLIKQRPARTFFCLPLNNNSVITISDDSILTLYNLVTCQIVKRAVLPGMPRKVAILNQQQIIILIPQLQSIFIVIFGKSKVPEVIPIHEFQSTTHHLLPKNIVKQKQFYSTMLMQSFLSSGNFFLREQSPQYHKFSLVGFNKIKDGSEWSIKSKQIGHCSRRMLKMDEVATVVLFKDSDIQRNGTFQFTTIDINSLQEQEIALRSQSFNQFAIVVAVRKYKEDLFVQVNRKDPELICFRNQIQHASSFGKSNVLWLVSLGPFLLDLTYSFNHPHLLQLSLRNGLKAYDRISSRFQNKQMNGQGMIIDYQRQRSNSSHTQLTSHRLVSKSKLYLKLLTAGLSTAASNGYFCKEVLSLLNQ